MSTRPDVCSVPVVVALLGEVSTLRDGALVPVPGARARNLLVALARHPGQSRTAAGLIDDVWGADPPRSPTNALHTQISRLRAVLPDGALEAGPAGYRLTLDRDDVDLERARTLAESARNSIAQGDHRAALLTVDAAVALWRGEPGADLVDEAASVRDALDALAVEAAVAVGDWTFALPIARARAALAPLDETRHLDLMRVLRALDRGNDALEVFAAIRHRLADELGADPSAALVELNTAILRGPAPTPQRTAIGLRAAPNPLLGRQADIAAIEHLVRTSRVTTILGPGGAGKTRVANEIGSRSTASVVLVELAPVRSGDDVVGAISSTLGVSEVVVEPGAITRSRVRSIRERLREAVSARPMLLILDNCEHVIDAIAEVVADLVAASSSLTVVTTSRSPLAITAEAVYPLPPLAIDPAGSPATDLFAARAKAVRPGARLNPDEVARLCRTLDGLPLAIELAAARIRTMSVEEINAGLGKRFALLRGGDRTSPERHRTLHAVIEWSWNLLDETEHATLRRLCRFPGGFTLSAAQQVAGPDAAIGLDGLAAQSMIGVVEHREPVGVRYQMLETVREFGEEQLAVAGESELVDERMALWASGFAIDVAHRIRTRPQLETADLVEIEHDNLLVVLRRAVQTADARCVYTVFPILGVMWAVRGAHSEVLAWAPRVLAVDPRGRGESEIPATLLVYADLLAGLHLVIGGDLRALALTRVRLRALLRDRSDLDEATRFQVRLALSPVDGRGVARLLARGVRSADSWTRAAAFSARSNLRENVADPRGSIRDCTRALALAVEHRDRWGESMTCQQLGTMYGQSARYAEAVDYYRRSIHALVDLHAYDEIAQVRAFMAAALVGCGRLAEARAELAQLDDSEPSADANQQLTAISASRAELAVASGDTAGGLAHYAAALRHSDWPAAGAMPGPFGAMVAAAAVAAHVRAGRVDDVAGLVGELASIAADRLRQFPDMPQLGCVAGAVGIHHIAADNDPALGMRLLALAHRLRARQDLPSLRLAEHDETARSILGDTVVAGEIDRAASVRRPDAARETLDLLQAWRI